MKQTFHSGWPPLLTWEDANSNESSIEETNIFALGASYPPETILRLLSSHQQLCFSFDHLQLERKM